MNAITLAALDSQRRLERPSALCYTARSKRV